MRRRPYHSVARAQGSDGHSSTLYHAAFKHSRDAILFLDQERFLDANPAALALFDIPDLATLLELHPANLSPTFQPDGRNSTAVIRQHIAHALHHGRTFFEWQHRSRSGIEFPVEVSLHRIDLEEGAHLQAVVRDISERKQTEVAFKAHRHELDQLQHLACIGSWVCDFRHDEIRWSDTIYRIFGINREQWGATLESFMAAVHPDDRVRVDAALAASLNGRPYEVKHRVVRPDGTIRLVHERGQVEFDERERPAYMLGTVQDITEQQALEDSLRRLVAILDSTPDLVTMHDASGAMLYANAAGRRFFGFPLLESDSHWCSIGGWRRDGLPHESLSIEGTVRRCHPPEEAERILNEGIATALRDGVWQGETLLYSTDGDLVPVSQVILVHRGEDGEVSQTSTICRDISELRALEERLQQEKRLSDSILSSLPGIFYMLDSDGCLVQWNEQLARVTGRDSTSMKGTSGLDFFPAEEQPRIADAIQQTFQSGSVLVEARMKTLSGETPYLFNGYRIDVEGRDYLLGIGLDISRQKRLEAALSQQANTDHLTGIYNRQYFDGELQKSLERYRRYGSEIAVVLFDIDHFKAVNDTFGHDAGDRVLVELTELVSATLRTPDILARWGGEEFVILLPDTSLTEACALAERIRRCVEAEPFAGVGALTISLGVSTINDDDDAICLFKRLDNALYQAKTEGRNRVMVS
ncbi:diguanylate cyclase [Halomonas alkaliantarctica]|nr:diguanylate cyclase [Halomonas alkaliantarctica]